MTCQGDRLAQAIAFSVGEAIETRPCPAAAMYRVLIRLRDNGFTAEYLAEVCEVCERQSHQLRGFVASYPLRRDT